jgi:GNAT superfamily N-acetyltransferase
MVVTAMGTDLSIEEVRRLDGPIDDLADLLIDAVEGGASVGFVLPLDQATAAAWWRSLSTDLEAGRMILLVASVDGRVVGTAQLRLAPLPNARHRAEVAKVLVRRDSRRRGIARALMTAIEAAARREHRTLLILDTISDSEAVHLYRALGWVEAGSIPDYAAMPDGRLAPTTFFYKELN